MSDPRARARELAQAAIREGRPVAWFDELYREAEHGKATVPWADLVPNPHLAGWLPERGSGRALDVGCGLGDNAEEMRRRGYRVTAFDVSSAAVEAAKKRFPDGIDYGVADLLSPPAEWRRAFDLVMETYTLQVLPPKERAIAAAALRELVAPGGTLLVIARGREPTEPEGSMPWPLTRAEVEAIAVDGLALERFEDFMDDETLPVRRFRATFRAS